jgi:hypothetical protein
LYCQLPHCDCCTLLHNEQHLHPTASFSQASTFSQRAPAQAQNLLLLKTH